MNPGQEKFFNFILERTADGKRDEAGVLLNESFAKQADGTFGPEFLRGFIPKLLALIKPESVEEVKSVMMGFASQQNGT